MHKLKWADYNRSLQSRGALTVYLGSDLEWRWAEGSPSGAVGRPVVYPEPVILLALVLQAVYRLPLRQTTGLMRSVLTLANLSLPVPNPSTLCRRRAGVSLPSWPGGGRCIVVDSTGLQIRGPNTWLTTVHGEQRRTYRKVHLGVDPDTSLVVAGVVTTCQIHDSQALGATLATAELPHTSEVIGDGAYDRRCCYQEAAAKGLQLIAPPGKRAILHPEDLVLGTRNRAIEECRLLGREAWKRASGYHRRSLAESTMHRLKAAFGAGLKSRIWDNQVHEALLRAHILNCWATPKALSHA